MTALDTAIQKALESIGVSWCPAMFMPNGDHQSLYIPVQEISLFPSCVQAVEDEQSELDNGMIRRVINFYMFNLIESADNDILGEINPIFEDLTTKVIQFKDLVKQSFNCQIRGSLTKSLHSMDISDAGIYFTLEIDYYPCQL